MARTESKTFQCHPDNAQREIEIHQKFHWSLLSSQDVKTVDNSVERRGNSLYNVRSSEHYVKLTFSRDIDTPHLNEIKKLEEAYYGLHEPRENYSYYTPDTAGASCLMFILGVALTPVYGLGIVILIAYFVGVSIWKSNEIKAIKERIDRLNKELEQERESYTQELRRILSELEKYQ